MNLIQESELYQIHLFYLLNKIEILRFKLLLYYHNIVIMHIYQYYITIILTSMISNQVPNKIIVKFKVLLSTNII